MAYKIVFYSDFERQLKKKIKKNKALRIQTYKAISLLSVDITHPSLRLHKLGGDDIWAISVNKSMRIVLCIRGNEIYLLDIGTHDEVY